MKPLPPSVFALFQNIRAMARAVTRPTTPRFDLERSRREHEIVHAAHDELAKAADGTIKFDDWHSRESAQLRATLEGRASLQKRELMFGRPENSDVILLFIGDDDDVLSRVSSAIATARSCRVGHDAA